MIFAFNPPTIEELLKFKPIFKVFGLEVTFPTLLMFGVTLLVMIFFVRAFSRPKLVPAGAQNVAEAGVDFVRSNIALSIIGPEGEAWVPFLTAVFYWVLLGNLMSIVPGLQFPVTARMSYPAMLAILSWLIFNSVGIKQQGLLRYFKNMMFPPGVPWWVRPILALIELFSTVIVRPLTLAVRLFANMFAGHTILAVLFLGTAVWFQSGLGKVFFVLPFILATMLMALELFVILMQAFIITILSAVYIAGAMHPEH